MSEAAQRYPASVFWSDEDAGFIATAPDLPGCSAFGETQAKALAELQRAIEAWIEAANSAGNPIPEPSRPSVEVQPSGKLLVRMPRLLHANLIQGAKRENVSLNHYIVFLLTTATNYRTMGHAIGAVFWGASSIRISIPEPGHGSIRSLHLTTTNVVSTTSQVSRDAEWLRLPNTPLT